MAHTRKFAWVAWTLTALFIWTGCADVAPTGTDAGLANDAGDERPDAPGTDAREGGEDDVGEDTPEITADEANLTLCSAGSGDTCQPVEALDLGDLEAGQGGRARVLLSNQGAGDAVLEAAQLEDGPLWSISVSRDDSSSALELPLTLEGGQELLIELRLSTASPPGLQGGTLALSGLAGDEPWRLGASVSARVASCAELRDSCDGDWSNGCEVDLRRDSAHCGGCDRPCAFEGGAGSCVEGRCAAQVCRDDFYGPECDPCPGLSERGPCSGRGVCDDGVEGDGTCACESGYEGPACDQDIDECAEGTDDCALTAICENEPGAYTCTCSQNTFGDGVTCVPCRACPSGTFPSEACAADTDTACQACDAACEGCDGPSDADCVTCAEGYVAEGLRCLLAGPPVASCRDATISLDPQGDARLDPAEVDNGSAAQAGIATIEVTPADFTCDALGANTVTLNVTDTLEQSDSCAAEVTVVDDTPPSARCATGVAIEVPSGGVATVDAALIDDNSDDACGVVERSVSPSSFTAGDVGLRRVTLSLSDGSANLSTCEADVEVTAEVAECPCAGFVITAVFDGPLTGGTPKGVELTACQDIADASQWGLGSANNGEGSDGQEFTFPNGPVAAGQRVYVVSEVDQFTAFFGFPPDHVAGALNINGDDAVELYFDGRVVDLFGDVNVDGTNQPWEYLDGWAARRDGVAPSTTFDLISWDFSGPDALDDAPSNADAISPVPVQAWLAPPGCP